MFLGIDTGLTVIKAGIFDEEGEQIGVGSSEAKVLRPKKDWYERDLNDLWNCVVKSVRGALTDAEKNVVNINEKIKSVGLAGYGDGCFLLDRQKKPICNGILSYDGRAENLLKRLRIEKRDEEIFRLSGQNPFPAFAPILLRWFKENKKNDYDRIRYVLFCKDFVRSKLTGEIKTDVSDASAGFTNYENQNYDNNILEICGISEMQDCLPVMGNSYELGGYLTKEAQRIYSCPKVYP